MKVLLSSIALVVITFCLYLLWHEIGAYQQDSRPDTTQAAQTHRINAPAVADDTLASVDIDTGEITGDLKNINILVLGDSLTAGYGIVLEKSWVYLLEDDLRNNYDDAYRVINAGISGDTTGGGLARLTQALEEHQPTIVIIELGGNDGLRGYPVNTIRDNLQKIIKTVDASGAISILAGIQIPPNYGERYTSTFAEIYPSLATQENTHLIPFILDGVALKEKWMQKDGIHPNEDGQEQIKTNVMDVLSSVISD